MDIDKKGDYQLDFVYKTEGSDDYSNVNVVLKVLESKMALNIYSTIDIKPHDLKNLITNLQKELLNRIKIDINKDCVIYLFVDTIECFIDYNKGLMKIYRLIHTTE